MCVYFAFLGCVGLIVRVKRGTFRVWLTDAGLWRTRL